MKILSIIIASVTYMLVSCAPDPDSSGRTPSVPGNQTRPETTPIEHETTPTESQPVVKDCPNDLKIPLADFQKNIALAKDIAEKLKNNGDIYNARELKSFGTGEPIGFAFLHCNPDDEIKKFAEDKCNIDAQEIDMKKIKQQCQFAENISSAANKLAGLGNQAISALPAVDQKSYQDYIKLIVDSFAQ